MSPPARLLAVMSALHGGGAERQMNLVLQHLDRSRFSPTLCLFSRNGPFLEGLPSDMDILDLDKRSRWDVPQLVVRLTKLIRRRQPHVIYSRGDYANEIVSIAHFLAQSPAALVLSEESVQSEALLGMSHARLRRTLLNSYRRADAILGPSPGVLEDLQHVVRVNPNVCHVTHNMVDVRAIRSAADASINLPVGDGTLPLIVSIGRLRHEKGHVDLLRAFSDLLLNIRCNLIILGDGQDRAKLEAIVDTLGIQANVYMPGYVSNPFPILSRSDVFVSASHHESFGNSILEAMSLGIPVVSTCVASGPKWLIKDGLNGVFCRSEDPEDLADKIKMVLSSPALADHLTNNAAATVSRFDPPAVMSRLEATLLTVIRDQGAGEKPEDPRLERDMTADPPASAK